MRTFRDRPIKVGDDYVFEVDDSDEEWSEVEAVFNPGNFVIQLDGESINDTETDSIASSDADDTVISFGSEDEPEDISLEGYFAFGGRLRSRPLRPGEVPHSPSSQSNPTQETLSQLPPLRVTIRNTPFSPTPGDRVVSVVNVQDQQGNVNSSMETNNVNPMNIGSEESTSTANTLVKESVDSSQVTENPVNEKSVERSQEKENDCAVSESGESEKTEEKDPDDHDVTCNPMVSDIEEYDENDDIFRGDRIGSSMYSERHVLKILIKWVQELPKYTGLEMYDSETEEKTDESTVDRTRFLEPDFEEEMSLLWDMSNEQDVMTFLVEHNIFNIIRNTLDSSQCYRLLEIALGILANIISQQSIIEDFSIHDASFRLVEAAISISTKYSNVPILIQVFAVLRRVTWFLRNVAVVKTWMDLLLSKDFFGCANFILSSSINGLLLSNVIITMYSIIESFANEVENKYEGDDEESSKEEGPSRYFGKALEDKKKDFDPYKPFCESEFVPSLCEGLKELMKDPKPRKTHKLTSTRDVSSRDASAERVLNDLEPPIPDGMVQMAILNGFGSFFYLSKTPNGKACLRDNHYDVMGALLDFLKKFTLFTDMENIENTLDYYCITVNLLTLCHRQLSEVCIPALTIPTEVSIKLMDVEEEEFHMNMVGRLQEKDGIMRDSRTFIALVVHEYLASVSDCFGQKSVMEFKNNQEFSKFFKHIDKLVMEIASSSDHV